MTNRRDEAGLTLVELMIAIALMLIMVLQLQIIFGNARGLYLGADAMAQVYSNTRSVLDQIEKDVANAIKTDQMEFYNDNRATAAGVGHYNPGEENLGLMGKVIPGRYIHSFLVKQPKPYTPKDIVKVGGPYRHDSIYFRTFTNIMGVPREALVEYRLWLGNDDADPRQRPILQRIVTGPKIDKNTGVPQYDAAGNPLYERQDPQDVCYYVQEFKVEMFITDKSHHGHIGRFYSPKDVAVQRVGQQQPAQPDNAYPASLVNLSSGDTYAVEAMDGADAFDQGAVMSKADGRLHLRNGDRVSQLGPGDKMYCISKPDAVTANTSLDFNNAYLTVKHVNSPSNAGGETTVEFEEEADIQRLIPNAAAELTMAYRGAWLPAAIRVQMKIKD